MLVKICSIMNSLVTLAIVHRALSSTITNKELRVLGMFPMSGTRWAGGPACNAPLEMALHDVNTNPDILHGYNLTLDIVDSQCNPGLAVFKFMDILSRRNDRPYVIVLGPFCSDECKSTAEVSHMWNLTQLTPGGGASVLSDRERFPTFYRMASPATKYVNARLDLLKKFNWKRIATIVEAREFFTAAADDFIRQLPENGITVIAQEVFLADPTLHVNNLKLLDARIIYAPMYSNSARRTLCAAYKAGLYGPKIVWLFPGWFVDQFWQTNLEEHHCTVDEMATAVEGAFFMAAMNRNPVDERGVANITVSEFDERFYSHHLYDPAMRKYERISTQCYDAIWLIALALNSTIQTLADSGHSKTLDEFTYSDGDINRIIYETLGRIYYIGVAGRISFITGDPDRIVRLHRIQDGKVVTLAFYRQDKQPSYYEWIEGALTWKDGVIPRDSTHVTYMEVLVPTTLYTVMCILACLGIVLSTFFFRFNLVHRENRVVKMSSPNINNVLLLGCVMSYITVFLKQTEKGSAHICKARLFIFALGFTIVFGSLFSKTWRVYRIFINKNFTKRFIKDKQLLVMIGVFVGVVLLVLVTWQLAGPHVMVVQWLEKENYMIGNDAEVRPFIRICQSSYEKYFSWGLVIIEGGLLAVGAFLAFETRKVSIEALNDSHEIGLSLYNVVVLSAMGLTLSVLFEQDVSILYGVTSACLVLGTTLTQLVIFIPKVHAVYNKQPELSGPTITTHGVSSGTPRPTPTPSPALQKRTV